MPLVAFVDKLVRTSDELQVVDMIELRGNFVSEQPPGTTGTNGPSLHVLGVTPNQIAEGAFVRDLLSASDNPNLIEGADFRTQATMDAENFAINDSRKREKIENLTGSFPDRGVTVLLLAFFVEPVDLSDLARLMIAADERDTIWVSDRKCQPVLRILVLSVAYRAFRQSKRVSVSKLK